MGWMWRKDEPAGLSNIKASVLTRDMNNGEITFVNAAFDGNAKDSSDEGNVQPPVSYTGHDLILMVIALLFFVLATFGFCCACAMGFGFGYFASASSIKYNRINGGDETECDIYKHSAKL